MKSKSNEDFIQALLNKKKSSFIKQATKTNTNQKNSRKKDRIGFDFTKFRFSVRTNRYPNKSLMFLQAGALIIKLDIIISLK